MSVDAPGPATPNPGQKVAAGPSGPGCTGVVTSARTGVKVQVAGYVWDMALHTSFDSDRLAPRAARRAICDFLESNGMARLTDDAALLTSELVTNAVRYARGPIQLHAYLRGGILRLEVADQAAERGPAPRRARTEDENGRGIELIAKLSRAWGWQAQGATKTVWLELALPSPLGPRIAQPRKPQP